MIGNLIRKIYRTIRASMLHKLIPLSEIPFVVKPDEVIEVIGFFESYSGIGESARLCALSLKDSGYRVKCTSVEPVFRKEPAFKWSLDGFYTGIEKPIIRIFHLNPPMLPPAIFSIGFKAYKQSYNIGYWAWELEDIPAEWRAALRYVNAVMTPSEFTSSAIRKHTSKPVVTVLHPVSYNLQGANEDIRTRLNIPASTFLISSIFSFGSALERKNPQSLITCFKQAFNQAHDVMLVLKSNSGNAEEKKIITDQIADDQRIRLIDESWDRADLLGLIKASNLNASFHRSEGFGLTLAESLALNTPIIATNWSGNVDFCKSNRCYMVDYEMVPVESNNAEFRDCKNLRWAQVREDHAISLLMQAYLAERNNHLKLSPEIHTIINNDVYQRGLNEMTRLNN